VKLVTLPAGTEHGTQKAAHTGCECEQCAEGRAKRCGTNTGWERWACRCAACKTANTIARAGHKRTADRVDRFDRWLDKEHPGLAHVARRFSDYPGEHPYEIRTGPAQWEYDLLADRRLADRRKATQQ